MSHTLAFVFCPDRGIKRSEGEGCLYHSFVLDRSLSASCRDAGSLQGEGGDCLAHPHRLMDFGLFPKCSGRFSEQHG